PRPRDDSCNRNRRTAGPGRFRGQALAECPQLLRGSEPRARERPAPGRDADEAGVVVREAVLVRLVAAQEAVLADAVRLRLPHRVREQHEPDARLLEPAGAAGLVEPLGVAEAEAVP